MAVRKDKGHWQVDFQIHGRRYRRYSPHNTRESALMLESRIRQAIAYGEDVDVLLGKRKVDEKKDAITFRPYAEKWYETYVVTNNKLSTHRSKRNALDNHLIPWFGEIKLIDIKSLDVEEFKSSKQKDGLSPKTINNILSVLHKSLVCAEEWELVDRVPRIKLLRVPPASYKFLSPEESDRLLMGAENIFWFAMILCALRTGMRIGEICGLDWSDINWDAHTLIVQRSIVEGKVDSPKNNRTRIIPLTDDLYELFSAHQSSSGLIFPGSDGNHMRKSSWPWKALHRACKKAGLPIIGWHVLRHTFASQLTALAVPMKATQMLLGHSTISMTEKYAHLAPSDLRDAIATLPRSSMNVVSEQRNASYVTARWRPDTKT